MSLNPQTAQEDLAFMRALVSEGGSFDKSFGVIYGAAGLLYGLQCLINGWLLMSGFAAPSAFWITLGTLPTVLFTIVIIYAMRQRGDQPALGTGAGKRAVNGAFAGAGIANLVLAAVFGWIAYERGDWATWFLFPVVVAAFQGAIWYAAAILNRRGSSALTALAWFASAVVLGLLINDVNSYLMALGAVLLACMALPGYAIMRGAARQQA